MTESNKVNSKDTVSRATFGLVYGRLWAGISTPALQPGDPDPRPSDHIASVQNVLSFHSHMLEVYPAIRQ